MNVFQRIKKPTPKFFRTLRSIGLGVVAAAGSLLTAPITLPKALASIAGYLVVAGGVIAAVSQTTVDSEQLPDTNSSESPKVP